MIESNPLAKDLNKPMYSVGISSDGRTQLIINGDFGTSILTMDPDGVEQLIRLLEAAL